MRRRDFIKVFAGSAATWPLAARAQQSKVPVIGFLSARSPDESASLLAAFRQGLTEAGFVEDRNLQIEYRWARGDYEKLHAMAAELVHIPVAVLAAVGGDPSARAAAAATKTIPVVALFSTDPIKIHLIDSLGRPGGNVTGLSNLSAAIEPKRVGLLRELAPKGSTFGVLLNPDFPAAQEQLTDVSEAAKTLGVELRVLRAKNDFELDAAFDAVTREQIPALLIAADPFFTSRRDKLAGLAIGHRVAAIFPFREYALAGGLMSYGIDLPDTYRQLGGYAGRILKGATPAELPVLQPTKFECVINLKTAKAIGVKISENLLSLADEVIE
jgi:putative ABC transport system substrate-binding protein